MLEFILKKVFQEIIGFFQRWYLDGSLALWSLFFSALKLLDQRLAVVVNLKLISQPLYGDYSPVGRVIGPVFRLLRVLLGSAIYLTLFFIVLAVWFGWLSALPLIIFFIISQWGN